MNKNERIDLRMESKYASKSDFRQLFRLDGILVSSWIPADWK